MVLQESSSSSGTSGGSTERTARRPLKNLAGQLARRERSAAICFAGQGTPVLEELASLHRESPALRPWFDAIEERLHFWWAQRDFRWSGLYPVPPALGRWIADAGTRPDPAFLTSTQLTNPLIFATQMLRYRALVEEGLDEALAGVKILAGHSQGIMPALLIAESPGGQVPLDRLLLTLDYMVWQGFQMARCCLPPGEGAPMAAISGPALERLAPIVAACNRRLGDPGALTVTLENTRTRSVISGRADHLAALRAALESLAAEEGKLRKLGRFGGKPLGFTWEDLAVGGPFHSPWMAPGLVEMRKTVVELGFRMEAGRLRHTVLSTVDGEPFNTAENLTEALLVAQFIRPVRWAAVVRKLADLAPDLVLDLGPGDGVSRLTASGLRGAGIPVLALSPAESATAALQALFGEGQPPLPRPVNYADLRPRLALDPAGRPAVHNRFATATGQPPVFLPGMTPTTADVPIVAAAANAGFLAELAGGGQVTEAIFWRRMDELALALDPGREVVFNALFLDPYLWDLHIRKAALVLKARRLGYPIRGVTISAGIPELDEAVRLLGSFAELGLSHNAFKPGTVAQVEQVVRIARAVPDQTIFLHLEGGRAGGHHSWEDLDSLLLDTYASIREQANLVLCVGGGIGLPGRAASLITGAWSERYSLARMPVDAVFLGTMAMACAEATTSPQAKAALVAAAGSDRWVLSGEVAGGVTSGKSQLGADIHYLENAAARAGRLLDEVAGDAAKVAARREEIIAALAQTCRPWFGDLRAMTWAEVLERAVTLMATGRSGPYEDGRWPDLSYRTRVRDLLARAEARLCPQESGVFTSVLGLDGGLAALDEPEAVLRTFFAAYPEARQMRLTATDADVFVHQICARPGKPVPFVPVIDADVRRWYKADSLWACHDDRVPAEATLIIPGPEALAGLTVANEPVAALLGRFCEAVVAQLQAEGELPGQREAIHPLDELCAAERWFFGRRSLASPLHTLTRPAPALKVEKEPGRVVYRSPDHPREQVVLEAQGEGALFSVETGVGRLDLPLRRLPAGGWDLDPAVHYAAVRRYALGALLGEEVPETPLFTPVSERVSLPADQARAYAAVVEASPGEPPLDLVFSLLWRPLLRALAAPELAAGLLRLVHLENRIVPLEGWPVLPGETLSAEARVTRVANADAGRTVDVHGALHRGDQPVASLLTRFFIRRSPVDAPAPAVRAWEPLNTTLTLDDAEREWLLSRPWIVGVCASAGDAPLRLSAWLGETRPARGPAHFTAEGTLRQGEQVVAEIRLDTRAPGGDHPLRTALLALTGDAGGSPSRGADLPRRVLAEASVRAPVELRTFAEVGGDNNPLHQSLFASRLAGLNAPIVHGMWTAARLRAFALQGVSPSRGREVAVEFLGPIDPGETVRLEVASVGRKAGDRVVEATAFGTQQPVARLRLRVAAPKTAWIFPGQGVQRQGMGMDQLARSPAARAAWERADAHTRDKLGFSVLRVVRENPKELVVHGERVVHPEGVLHLTAFTQVALAVLASAQTAELRATDAMPPTLADGMVTAGHSLGEYNALCAMAGVLSPESVIETVYARGLAMHQLVPRDARGESGYRMGVIRPRAVGLQHAAVESLVDEVGAETGAFVQIVNYNVRGSQYAVVGHTAALARLEARLGGAGSRGWAWVPGVDVPFHSKVLVGGVADFRRILQRLFPLDADYSVLVGRYVPNLLPKPFSLAADFVDELAAISGQPGLRSLAASVAAGAVPASHLAQALVVELLAWQFTSPVRWIETQELLLRPVAEGGLGCERIVEVGLGHQPVLANMARATLAGMGPGAPRVVRLNAEADRAELLGEGPETAPAEAVAAPASKAGPRPAASAAPGVAPSAPAQARAPAAPITDRAVSVAEALRALLALQAKLRPEQLRDDESLDALFDGVSSRRNQALMDIGAEFACGAIDGAQDKALSVLGAELGRRASGYRFPGPYLRAAGDEAIRRLLGRSGWGRKELGEALGKLGFGPGLSEMAVLALTTAGRDGESARGGALGLGLAPAADRAGAQAVAQRVAEQLATTLGFQLATEEGEGGTAGVDPALLLALEERLLGPAGVLTRATEALAAGLGSAVVPRTDPPKAGLPVIDAAQAALDALEAEHGKGYAEAVAPRFDARRHVAMSSAWAWAARDVARLAWAVEAGVGEEQRAEALRLSAFAGEPRVADAAQAFSAQADREGRTEAAALLRRITEEPTPPLEFAGRVALVTGASPGSIAAALLRHLLRGGARVVATTSTFEAKRLRFFRDLYQAEAGPGAELHVVPFNQASLRDCDALLDWVIDRKGGQAPDLLVPFAALRDLGPLSALEGRSSAALRALLLGVERLVAGLGARLITRGLPARPVSVLLPLSPNHGVFGGDGTYAEGKAGLEALLHKVRSEAAAWGRAVALTGARIGWVRGTGLMEAHDVVAERLEAAGLKTFSAEEMAAQLAELCRDPARAQAELAPQVVDLTGGFGQLPDIGETVRRARAEVDREARLRRRSHTLQAADRPQPRPALPRGPLASTPPAPDWPAAPLPALDQVVVIVGHGELGPWGSARTRVEVEQGGALAPAGVLELAWMTGLLRYQEGTGWVDAASGETVPEEQIGTKYAEAVRTRAGLRFLDPASAGYDPEKLPVLATIYLDRDLSFPVASAEEAESFLVADPEHTRVSHDPGAGTFTVTRTAGAVLRVPRRFRLKRTVAGLLPDGFDPVRFGVPRDMVDRVDRIALINLIATLDAFLCAGLTPDALMAHLHPARVANTIAGGIGGMVSLRRLFGDLILNEERQTDTLQETLINVVAAHVVSSLVGSYGAMAHPVGACASAAVSLELGLEQIRSGRAEFVVAGGYDDIGPAGALGFQDMAATADTDEAAETGLLPEQISRPNDRRRRGFVEAQGGGTVLLARGDVAAALGLPVYGVLAWAGSFGDGLHRSMPAPGLGLVAAALGGGDSPLGKALGRWGLGADDLAMVFKHDTSTQANDYNEGRVHHTLQKALGRTPGNPLWVVSQKSLTGHAKGGSAAWQTIGLCQALEAGVIPGNNNLECVDEAMRPYFHLGFTDRTLRPPRPMRAGLLTSLGFGHVNAIAMLLHPDAFRAALPAEHLASYDQRAAERRAEGARTWEDIRLGRRAAYHRPKDRRFEGADGSEAQVAEEIAMLLDPEARLDPQSGRYRLGRP